MNEQTSQPQYRVRYVYDKPSSAGPFKGAAVVSEKLSKGDFFYGPFGAATVTSCSLAKARGE